MDYIKLQFDIKESLNYHGNWCYQVLEEGVFISQGHAVWIIPHNKFSLNLKKLIKRNIMDYLKTEQGYTAAERGTKNKVVCSLEDCYRVQIKNEKTEAYVNEEYLKYFQNPTFEIKAENEPVIVKENNKTVAYILPIIRKERGQQDEK